MLKALLAKTFSNTALVENSDTSLKAVVKTEQERAAKGVDVVLRGQTSGAEKFQLGLLQGGFEAGDSLRMAHSAEAQDDDDGYEGNGDEGLESELAPLVGLVGAGRVAAGEGVLHELKELAVHILGDAVIESLAHSDDRPPLEIIDFTDQEAEDDFKLTQGGRDDYEEIIIKKGEAEADFDEAKDATYVDVTTEDAEDDFDDANSGQVEQIDFSDQEAEDDFDLANGGNGDSNDVDITDDEANEDWTSTGGGDSDVTFTDDEAMDDWDSMGGGGGGGGTVDDSIPIMMTEDDE